MKLTLATVGALATIGAAHAEMPGAMEDCGNLYNQYRAMGRAGGYRGDDLLKATGSLCPNPSESAFSTAKGPSDWFTANNDGECAPVHKMTPAWVIDYDEKRGITDHTRSEVRNPDGTLASVDVVMPENNGMVLVYHYFHTLDGCTAYQASRTNKLKDLR
jgi:hypothetical protein